ncbi:MAG: acetoacetate decarboxylase family protein [Roseiflexaceae bacterium]|nr:acetoacetate decarboxylase family protein [Roseiflexaceae bacterium]
MTLIVPPPWMLTGNGLILLYRFPRAFAEPWLPPELRQAFLGGIGAVMCVDYHSANCGPYRELLFVPGAFRLGGRIFFNVSTIYVSTEVSVQSGRANWGIPKQLADFEVAPGLRQFTASRDGVPFFRAAVRGHGPFFPANTAWSPAQPALVQPWAGKWLRTRPGGRGAVQLAGVEQIEINGAHFPDIGQLRPLAALRAHGFELRFPFAAPLTMNEFTPNHITAKT